MFCSQLTSVCQIFLRSTLLDHASNNGLTSAACLVSLTKLAKEAASIAEAEVFSDFVGALMNSLIYLLEDSLLRLQDIHRIEAAKKDEAAWQAAGPA